MSADNVHPVDIVHHQASGQLDIGWSDGLQASISSHALRGACRCAACVKLPVCAITPIATGRGTDGAAIPVSEGRRMAHAPEVVERLRRPAN